MRVECREWMTNSQWMDGGEGGGRVCRPASDGEGVFALRARASVVVKGLKRRLVHHESSSGSVGKG